MLKLCLLGTLYCHSILTSGISDALFCTLATRSCCICTLYFVACMRERPEGKPAIVLSCTYTRRLICCHSLLPYPHTQSSATVWLSQASAASARCSLRLIRESMRARLPLRSDAAATDRLQPPALESLSTAPMAKNIISVTCVQRQC